MMYLFFVSAYIFGLPAVLATYYTATRTRSLWPILLIVFYPITAPVVGLMLILSLVNWKRLGFYRSTTTSMARVCYIKHVGVTIRSYKLGYMKFDSESPNLMLSEGTLTPHWGWAYKKKQVLIGCLTIQVPISE